MWDTFTGLMARGSGAKATDKISLTLHQRSVLAAAQHVGAVAARSGSYVPTYGARRRAALPEALHAYLACQLHDGDGSPPGIPVIFIIIVIFFIRLISILFFIRVHQHHKQQVWRSGPTMAGDHG